LLLVPEKERPKTAARQEHWMLPAWHTSRCLPVNLVPVGAIAPMPDYSRCRWSIADKHPIG
jgi:hypothetical protein